MLILDQVRDPGNLGTLLRTALAGGMTGVVCMKGTVDPWSPKVVRATMSAAFKLPLVVDVEPEALRPLLQRSSLPLYFLVPGTPKVYFDVIYPDAYGIVVGNENKGISPALKACHGEEISIPLIGPIESLNAGVAGGIVIYEALRQKVLRDAQ
ncbi:MAG TPA: RNA methyltransferase [Firmicutes bacterium]|nr:RNA methyltransferase [Bacillota bacterium]